MVSYAFSVCAVAVPDSKICTVPGPFTPSTPSPLAQTYQTSVECFLQDDKTVPPQKDGARARSYLWQSLKGLSTDLNPSPRAT